MDLQLPEGDGSEATPAIRSKEKTNRNHEVVVASPRMP
jgi:hypothetical protein